MSLQDEHDIATKRPDVKEAYTKLTDAITGARTSMTAQGKPDRCPSCGSDERSKCNLLPTPAGYEDLCCDDWHSSPVPAARKGSAEMDDGTHIEFAKNLVTAKPVPAAAPTMMEGVEAEQKKDEEVMAQWSLGAYTGETCPNCGRVRICKCPNGKRRCEKCNWVIEEGRYLDTSAPQPSLREKMYDAINELPQELQGKVRLAVNCYVYELMTREK